MLFDVLFVIFFYFTHKQIYAGTHFTGASKTAAMIVLIFGGVNTLLQYAYLIFLAIKDSFFTCIDSRHCCNSEHHNILLYNR